MNGTTSRRRLGLLAAGSIAFAAAPRCRAQATSPVEWNRDVRPILAENCFACHGPDLAARKASLRLDTAAGLFEHAPPTDVVVPGKPERSELVRRMLAASADDVMPPPATKKVLTPAQKDVLQRWIAEGARFEGHWAFQPIRPGPATTGAATASSAAIDRAIAGSPAAKQVQPSPEADRITLLRRLGFDLIGLPPTAAEAAAFIADRSQDAYERVVDRLLASPHFGERMAIWWLDLVRYADTVGYHGDQPISASPYRDYVIASFHGNKPFDVFTIEQLAGDLLPEATREQRVASGYNRIGMMSAEGGVQDKEYLAKYIAERVRNASGTWLGITLGCAECHDHKFDPFTARDFYRFEAFFADIRERGLYAGANDDGNWGPFIKVPTAPQAERLADLDRQLAEAQQRLDTPTPALAAAQQAWERSQATWTVLAPTSLVAPRGTKLSTRADGAVLASGEPAATATYELTFDRLPIGVTAFRLDVLPDGSLPNQGPGRASNGNFVLTEFMVRTTTRTTTAPVVLQNPSATYEQTGAGADHPYGKWAIAAALDGDSKGAQWGWAVMERTGRANSAIFETTGPLALEPGAVVSVVLAQEHGTNHTLGCFRLAVTTATPPPTAAAVLPDSIEGLLRLPHDVRTTAQLAELAAYFRSIAPELQPARERLAALQLQRQQLDATIASTPVTESVPPREIRVLRRGNWMDATGEVVTAGVPAIFAAAGPAAAPRNRLDLARWLVAADNPLVARVFVNRVWKLLFGAGLSRKLDDLGAQGEWPSHPELLDQLAADFRSDWNVKRLVQSIVMSRSYRQSSHADALARERDPDNRWLLRQGRFRLDAELVRDAALAISGLLVPTIGGRSVFPHQPPGYWAYLNFPTREWRNGTGDELHRRGLYTHWQRQYLHPSLLAFDAPSREECTADRARSNTPLQSLVLLNDPSHVEAARAFADQVLQSGGTTARQRLDFAFLHALSRPATDAEAAVLTHLLDAHATQYTADPQAAAALLAVAARPALPGIPLAEQAAWTSVTRTILNLHEVITRN